MIFEVGNIHKMLQKYSLITDTPRKRITRTVKASKLYPRHKSERCLLIQQVKDNLFRLYMHIVAVL